MVWTATQHGHLGRQVAGRGFALLGNFRAALIAALVIPITMLLTGFGMLRLGVSANLMSLGALDFGLIVDGAVIIVENALRRIADRQHGEGRTLALAERLKTVASAAREMIRPTVYGQAIVMLVYVPLLTLTGAEGRTFEPMALTVIIALAFAFVLSLTFVPAAIAIAPSKPVAEKENRIVGWLHRCYAPGLDRALARPKAMIGIALAALALGAAAFATLGQEFLPLLDEGDVLVSAFRVPGTSVEQSQTMQFQIERALRDMPEIRTVFSRTGTAEVAADPMPPNATDTFIMLKDRKEWPNPSDSKADLVARIEARLATVPGHAYEVTQPIQMRFNELIAGVRSDVAVKVFGEDFAGMNATAARIAAVLRRIPGAEDVKVEQTEGLPMLDIAYDQDRASRIGVSAQDVAGTVATAVGAREAGRIYEGDRSFPVVVRLADATRANLDALGQTPVQTPGGAFVPLASVVADAQAAVARDVPLPAGTWLTWGGQFENLASARDRLMLVVPACFALILLLLYGALRSVRDAAIVFTGVPLALVGGAIALLLRGMPFSISAAVGFIALSGIAVLNGLLMLTSIRKLVEDGHDTNMAAREGALARLRPVAMTALVGSLGFLPMALGHGAGAEVQKPLATVVIGGLVSATLLTLFVLPTLFARFAQRAFQPS